MLAKGSTTLYIVSFLAILLCPHAFFRSTLHATRNSRLPVTRSFTIMASSKASTSDVTVSSVEGMQQLLFVQVNKSMFYSRTDFCTIIFYLTVLIRYYQMGFGCDQHGQDATKAAVKACRNAIEWNSLPSINQIVPGGYDAMKVSGTGSPRQRYYRTVMFDTSP